MCPPNSVGLAGKKEQGLDYLNALLEAIMRAGFPNRIGKLPQCAGAIQKLQVAGAVLPADEPTSEGDEEI